MIWLIDILIKEGARVISFLVDRLKETLLLIIHDLVKYIIELTGVDDFGIYLKLFIEEKDILKEIELRSLRAVEFIIDLIREV